MTIDKKFLSWVAAFSIVIGGVLATAEDRWNQEQKVEAAKKAGNGTAYLMYSTVVKGLKRDAKRLRLKVSMTIEDKVEIEDLEEEIKEIKEHQKGLLE